MYVCVRMYYSHNSDHQITEICGELFVRVYHVSQYGRANITITVIVKDRKKGLN